MNKKNSASIRNERARVSTRLTPFRITECGRRTTIGLDDGFAFDPGAGRRTVAFLASRTDPNDRLVDLAVVAAVCGDDGILVDRLGEALVGLPPDACLGRVASEAPWSRTLDQALQIVNVVVAHGAWAQRRPPEPSMAGSPVAIGAAHATEPIGAGSVSARTTSPTSPPASACSRGAGGPSTNADCSSPS